MRFIVVAETTRSPVLCDIHIYSRYIRAKLILVRIVAYLVVPRRKLVQYARVGFRRNRHVHGLTRAKSHCGDYLPTLGQN